MDEFEKQHMGKWLDTLFQPRFRTERDQLEKDLIELTNEYPELLKTHSWPEMRRLVIRKKETNEYLLKRSLGYGNLGTHNKRLRS